MACWVQRSACEELGYRGKDVELSARMDGDPLAFNDSSVGKAYCSAVEAAGNVDAARGYRDAGRIRNGTQVLLVARCLAEGGEVAEGADVLLGELKREPYNKTLRRQANELLEPEDIAADQKARLRRAGKAPEAPGR